LRPNHSALASSGPAPRRGPSLCFACRSASAKPRAPLPGRGRAPIKVAAIASEARRRTMREARRPQPVLAVAALLALIVSAAPLRAAEILQESLSIPVVVGGATVELDALVMRPNDQRPHPLAVINHGAPRTADDRATMSPLGMSTRALSSIAEPTTTTSSITAGGEVM